MSDTHNALERLKIGDSQQEPPSEVKDLMALLTNLYENDTELLVHRKSKSLQDSLNVSNWLSSSSNSQSQNTSKKEDSDK